MRSRRYEEEEFSEHRGDGYAAREGSMSPGVRRPPRASPPYARAAAAAEVAHVHHMMQHHMNNLQVRGSW